MAGIVEIACLPVYFIWRARGMIWWNLQLAPTVIFTVVKMNSALP